MTGRRPLAVFLLASIVGVGCSPAGGDKTQAADTPSVKTAAANRTSGCIENFDSETDYFPSRIRLSYATNFSIEYRKSYKIVSVVHASQGGPGDRYVLYQCGAPKPELSGDLAGATVVRVPITSLYANSSTHYPLLNELDRLDVLTGIGDSKYVTDEGVLARLREGNTIEYQKGDIINAEFIVSRAPSMVMATGNSNPEYAALRLAGIPLVANTEWLETTALGRAEWLKFMAVFLNEEEKAEEKYGAIVSRYMAMVERTKDIPEEKRVKVMTGTAFRGAYSTAGGRSYVAGLIKDAGGLYVWADNQETGIVTVDTETELTRASNADVWINGGEWKTLKDMLADDPRYSGFKAYRNGQVWLYDKRRNPVGANDYWTRGVTHPDRILGDLIKIFYPHLAQDYEFEWYRQVSAK